MLKESLKSSGVDCGACRDVQEPTGTAIIMLQPSGQFTYYAPAPFNQ